MGPMDASATRRASDNDTCRPSDFAVRYWPLECRRTSVADRAYRRSAHGRRLVPAPSLTSRTLEVLERHSEAKRFIQYRRPAVHGVRDVPAAGPVEAVLLNLADPRPVLIEMDDQIMLSYLVAPLVRAGSLPRATGDPVIVSGAIAAISSAAGCPRSSARIACHRRLPRRDRRRTAVAGAGQAGAVRGAPWRPRAVLPQPASSCGLDVAVRVAPGKPDHLYLISINLPNLTDGTLLVQGDAAGQSEDLCLLGSSEGCGRLRGRDAGTNLKVI